MDSEYENALVALESEMKLNLSVEGMIPLFERDAGGFMTREERMQVISVNKENTPEMVSRIVSILRKKGNEQFFMFLSILDKSGNEVWSNKLREHIGIPQPTTREKGRSGTTASSVTQRKRSPSPSDSTSIPKRQGIASEFNCEQFMDKYKGRFLEVVAAKDIAGRLEIDGIIPSRLHHAIEQTDPDKARELLYMHLCTHGAPSTIRPLCDIMAKERGYPKMNSLGKDMKEDRDLPQGGQSEVISTDPKITPVSVQPSVSVLKSKPSQKDLEKIKKKVGANWRSLLFMLGVDIATIDGFSVSSQESATEACFKGLVHWQEGNADRPVTWETLLKALSDADMKGFVDDLEKELTSRSQGDQNDDQSDPLASRDPEQKFSVMKTSQDNSVKTTLQIHYAYLMGNLLVDNELAAELFGWKPRLLNERTLNEIRALNGYGRHSEAFLKWYQFAKSWYTEERLRAFCECLEKAGKDARSKLIEVAKKIRKLLRATSSVPQPPNTSAGDTSPSQHPQSLELDNMSPSDIGLQGILEICPLWDRYAISLGLSIDRVKYYYEQHQENVAGLLALKYWRDGGCGSHYPTTWKFLLDVIKDDLGPKVAEVLEKLIITNDTWTLTTPRATSSVREPPSTFARDPSPSQHSQSLEFYNMSPSDIGLQGILDEYPCWYKYAISLGLSIDRIKYYMKQHQLNVRGLLALKYWRDGGCGSRYPTTWKFLLDVINNCMGSKVAEDLEKLIIANDTWTMTTPRATSSVPQPPSTSAQDTSPSQHPQSLELDNMSPSDIGLQGILGRFPLLDKYAIYLGLTSDRIKYYYEQRLGIKGELLALKYWRDGGCGSRYPPTWKFLLDVIRDCGELKVAKDLEKLIITYDTWTLTSPRDLFGDEFEEVIKSHACIELTITKCTTIGPPRVGKTCLKHLLTGKKWDVKKEMTPTPAIRAPEWVERYRGESKNLGMNWSRFTPEERIQALYQSIAQKEYEENVASNQPDESQDMQADVLSTHKGHSPKEMDVQTPSLVLEVHSMDSDEDPNEVMQSSVQEDVQMLEMELEELNIPVGLQQTKGKEGRILHKMEILHFVDTGGQDIYHDVHPVLITSPSVYLVVFNLQDCFPPKLKADFLTSDLTQRALRSIHTLTFKSPEDNNYLRCHPEQPTIFIIGTHLDMVPSAYLDGLHSVMVKKIDNMPYRNYIQYDPNERCFWAVDSTQAGKNEENEEYLSRLRDLIIEESAMMKLSIPIPWLLLEELTANCKPLFAFNSLCEFAETKELVKNADEFKLMLRVFHVLGLFFHDADTSEPQREQDDYVFVNPNALYTLTSKLFFGLKKKFEECGQKNGESSSTIIRRDINDLLKPTIEEMAKEEHVKNIFEIDSEWFIQLLCRLRLMATLGDDPHSQCIIPAILPYSNKSQYPVDNSSVGSLLLTFVTSDRQFSYLPSGLFCGFIADVIRTQPGGLQWDPKELYRNLITFSLPFGILRIEEKKAFLKFDLTIKQRDNIHAIAKNCQDLRKTIHGRLREAWEGLYKQPSEEFKKIATWGLPCTYHKLPDDSDQDDPGHIAEYISDPETGVFCAACLKPHSGLMQSVSRNEAVWFGDTKGELVELM